MKSMHSRARQGANRSNSLAIARICNNADRPIPRLHTRVEIVNTL